MAPHNRPEVESTKKVYIYGDTDSETNFSTSNEAVSMVDDEASDEELHFDSCFESGNLLSATRLYRVQLDKEASHGTIRSENDRPWVVEHEYDLQMHPDLKTNGNTQVNLCTVAID